MKYLGIDYGSKRIGIATSDEGGAFAFPKMTLEADANLMEEIRDLIAEHAIEAVVIGVPEIASGGKNPVEAGIRAFAAKIEEAHALPVHFQNEQFTSIEATRFAPSGEKNDAVSAALILQRYLDAHPQGA